MATPRVLVLTGYGINCDDETRFAFGFQRAGGSANLVHINDLIESPGKLDNYQIVAFPGGFSYGDDTGSGNGLAQKIRNHLGVERFVSNDKLVIGICNGFQVLDNLGLVPALDNRYGERQAALAHNQFPRYKCDWIDLQFLGTSPWVSGVETISLPIAHGEGNFYCKPSVLQRLKEKGLIAARYVKGEICEFHGKEPNPNGSLDDIAGITDESGRILGMMPHPERAIEFLQLPHWTYLKAKNGWKSSELPVEGPGLQIFRNGVNYFK